jgi:hypothetical protein
MSRYLIKLTESDALVAEDVDLASSYCDIVFVHKLNGKDRIELKGLTFGFTLRKDGGIVHQFSYPPAGTQLIRSDQSYICAERVAWTPNAYYSISFWFKPFKQASITLTRDFLSTTGKEPYPSWRWNDFEKRFEAPVKEPSDGYVHSWNERKKVWERSHKRLSSLHERRA